MNAKLYTEIHEESKTDRFFRRVGSRNTTLSTHTADCSKKKLCYCVRLARHSLMIQVYLKIQYMIPQVFLFCCSTSRQILQYFLPRWDISIIIVVRQPLACNNFSLSISVASCLFVEWYVNKRQREPNYSNNYGHSSQSAIRDLIDGINCRVTRR